MSCVPKYPFRQMAVGQSFFAADYRAVMAARDYPKRSRYRFTSRRDGYGWRIWRVE
jgi:hypothetical protein